MTETGIIQDKQRTAFSELINAKIPDLVHSRSAVIDDFYTINFVCIPISEDSMVTEDGTDFLPVKVKCILKNNVTSEKVDFNVDLLNLPVFQSLGFRINGNYMQTLDLYERTTGWSFAFKGTEDSKSLNSATLMALNGVSFTFMCDQKDVPMVKLKSGRKADEKKNIPVSIFFRAVTGLSNQELLSMFGYDNPYVISAFNEEGFLSSYGTGVCVTRNECIKELADAMLGKNISAKLSSISLKQKEINNRLFSANYMNLGKSNHNRLEYSQSFLYRASGKTLAENVQVNGYSFKEGTILGNDTLEILDNLPITALKVSFNNKIYTLKKFSTFTFRALGYVLTEDVPSLGLRAGRALSLEDLERLNASSLVTLRVKSGTDSANVLEISRRTQTNVITQEDIFTAFGIWMDNLNGFDTYDKMYELTSRVVVPYDVTVLNLIDNHLAVVMQQLSARLRLIDLEDSMINAIPDLSKNIDLYRFINEIKDTQKRSGQLSDMCNVLGFTSKDYKVTSTIGAKNVTGDLVEVQDLQESRLDPFDSPESGKIGIVHQRCVLTKIDEDGYLTAPYLKVRDGVAEEEPVYLTATEEAGKYIAEWNETFKEADGSLKSMVKARCNGDVNFVPLSKITYKEYSPYQNLSPVHACIPFPGHSNGKRITMGCNQPKQAVPLVKRERPLVNAGGESLIDVGLYRASDLLHGYYSSILATNPEVKQFEHEILDSELQLKKIDTVKNVRTLTLSILAVEKINRENGLHLKDFLEVEYPYLLKNNETGMFSHDINHKPDGLYRPEDIVAYNNGISLEDKQHLTLMDTGAHQISDSVFNKGLALMKNILCVYKTWEGSTIDDAITLSSRMVYDDELTSISLMTVSMTLHDSDSHKEEFAKADDKYQYFDYNGLPVIGTILHPGDPAISKVVYSGAKTSVKYKYLNQYTEGQVVSAEIGMKNNEKIAEVVLASRSQIEVGDKLSGRVGNKGVIAKIVPYWEMPVIKDTGEIVDIILNPLGIPSRQNITQLLIAALSYCTKMDDKLAFVSPYNSNDVDFVREEMTKHDLKPSILIDGRTGGVFERPVNYGILSMYKLHHMARKKIHAIGMNTSVDPVFMQPRKGSKMNGGQSFGEMESWCLEAIGAKKVLQDLYTMQSNDVNTGHEAKEALENAELVDFTGENNNDLSMKACFQSMGIQMKSNLEEQEYEFVPMTDEAIKSLSLMPVENKNALHSSSIFGDGDRFSTRTAAMDKWGWIDLHARIINPLWVEKGSLGKLILSEAGFLSNSCFKDILEGRLFVVCRDAVVDKITIYADKDTNSQRFPSVESATSAEKVLLTTGMSALVWVFEHASTKYAEQFLEEKCRQKKEEAVYDASGDGVYSKRYSELVADLNLIKTFNRSDISLKDYVVSSFPVMPQTFRPVLHSTNVQTVPDFDWHYSQILKASKAVQNDDSAGNLFILYERIREFIGVGKFAKKSKYQNILNYFAGKDKNDNHGKIRSAMQSKRILCSGRAAIIPTSNIQMKTTQIGVPISMAVKLFESPLIGYFKSKAVEPCSCGNSTWVRLLLTLANKDFERFCSLYGSAFSDSFQLSVMEAYEEMRNWIFDFVENRNSDGVGQVVLSGRQPSLHKYSIKAYKPLVVEGKALQVHPLMCKGYNADFDGDQMWVTALISEDAKEEALELMSAKQDMVNPKNSKVMLEHSQDIALGIYCATMLKANSATLEFKFESVMSYVSVDAVKNDLDSGLIKPYQLVTLRVEDRNYFSTAGRVIFNSFLIGGFTKNPYSDPFCIEGNHFKGFCDLRYDGLITSGRGGRDSVVYYNLQDICKAQYDEYGAECLEPYQKIMEFGFLQADKCGVSLSLYDLDIDSGKQEILREAEELKFAIEQDFRDGLIAAEDKVTAIRLLYTNKTDGANTKIQANMIKNLARNSNLFIMMDSGARGNETQLMHMCGAIGVLQKTKTQDLEDAVTSNYYEGLGSFDAHMASYSARIGVATTQNETRKAGYATRQVVYMSGGVEIVAEDCGKEDWWFDVVWDSRIEKLDRMTPSSEWFKENLLGKTIAADDLEAIRAFGVGVNRTITQKCLYTVSMNGGFHSVRFDDGSSIIISIDFLRNQVLLPTDEKAVLYAKKLLHGDKITDKCIKAFERKFLKQVMTEAGTFTFRYKMDKGCRSLLLNREARNLKGLKAVNDSTYGKTVNVITEDTLQYVEEEGLDRIQARILLDCKCKHGICAHCYGLEYSKPLLPEIGKFVGIEAAQSAGEPAAQLTISLVNKGGVAGESIASGVAVFDGLLHGGAVGGASANTALVSHTNGYVEIRELDDQVAVSIVPEDKDCELCKRCKASLGMQWCPREYRDYRKLKKDPLCLVSDRLYSKYVLPQDGEWMYSGEYLTDNILVSGNVSSTILLADTIKSVNNDVTPEVVLRRKQMVWLLNYFHTFLSNNITINARHFEIFSRIQNQYVMVLDSDVPGIAPGSIHEINEILPYKDSVKFKMYTSKISEVTLWNSGAFTALSFEDIASVAAKLAVTCHKSSFKHNNAVIGCISIGSNLKDGTIKEIKNPHRTIGEQDAAGVAEQAASISYIENKSLNVFDQFSLDELLEGSGLDVEQPVDITAFVDGSQGQELSEEQYNLDNVDFTETFIDDADLEEEITSGGEEIQTPADGSPEFSNKLGNNERGLDDTTVSLSAF